MKKKKLLVVITFGMLILMLGGFLFIKGKVLASSVSEKKKEVVRPVPVAKAVMCEPTESREFPGAVRACRRVEMGFNTGGIITELRAKEGEKVKEGEVLARIDDRDCANAISSAKAVLKEAVQEYSRSKKLYENKVISKNDLDNSLAAWEVAKAALGVCQKNMADTVLLAPFDGIIAARYEEKYERVSAGQSILLIQDISVVEVVVQLPESMVANRGIDSFCKASVRFSADSNSEYYDCKVTEFRSTPDDLTKTYDVVLSLKMPEKYNVFPGMTADVKIEFNTCNFGVDENSSNAMLVPIESLWQDTTGNTSVWIIPQDTGFPESSQVVVEGLEENYAKISGNIRSGQLIAISGVNTLQSNMMVRPKSPEKKGLEG